MKILILGAGAVGGYFGARLINMGNSVTFLVRKKRASLIRSKGLNVKSSLGDLTVHPEIITSVNPHEKYDLAIISCKAYALDSAINVLAPLHQSTYVLPLLNGLSHYLKLEDVFGKERVLGGFAHLSTMLDDEGSIIHLNQTEILTLGALQPQQQPFIEFAKSKLHNASFIVFSDNIKLDIWKKLIFICTAASATSYFNNTIGAIASTTPGEELIVDSFKCNCKAAEFFGFDLDDDWKSATLEKLIDKESEMTSSLLRDMRNGSEIEISIIEDMMQKNEEAGITNDLLLAAHSALIVYLETKLRQENNQG